MAMSSPTSQTFSTRYLESLASTDSLPSPPPYNHGSTFEAFPSRASSIISTGTRTTLGTLVDNSSEENFDVHVGGAHYRIGLDGRVAPISQSSRSSNSHGGSTGGWRSSFEFAGDHVRDAIAGRRRSAYVGSPSRSSSVAISRQRERLGRRGSLPAQVGIEQHNVDERSPHDRRPAEPDQGSPEASRPPSFIPGREPFSVVRPQHVLHGSSDGRGPIPTEQGPGRLARRGGIKLRVTTGKPEDQQVDSEGSSGSPDSYHTATSETRGPEDGQAADLLTNYGQTSARTLPSAVDSDDGDDTQPTPHANRMFGDDVQVLRNKSNAGHRRRRSGRLPWDIGPPEENGTPPDTTRSQSLQPTEEDDAVHGLPSLHPGVSGSRQDLDRRDHDGGQMRQMVAALARQVLDMRTELSRISNYHLARNDPERRHSHQHDTHHDASARTVSPHAPRQEPAEGHSFHFPPLKLNNIKTIRAAMKRRAEKIRRTIGDEFGHASRESISSSSGDRQARKRELIDLAKQPGHQIEAYDPSLKDVCNDKALSREMLATSQDIHPRTSSPSPGQDSTTNNDLEAEIMRLRAALAKSQETTALYVAWCKELEQAVLERPDQDLY